MKFVIVALLLVLSTVAEAAAPVTVRATQSTSLLRWPYAGVAVDTTAGPQREVSASPDGVGGTLVAWRSGFAAGVGDIRVQRFDAAGLAQWGANGVVVCADPAMQADPQVASDGAGGAYIAWSDYRTGGHSDIYAQRVNASGATQWAANGILVSGTSGTDENDVRVLADGAGNVILAWRDQRTLGATQTDCYAQKLDASGAKLWGASDVAVSTSLYDQDQPMLVTDGLGGAFVLWHDVFQDSDIWGQHLNANGSSAWTAGGVPIGAGPLYQFTPAAVSDGAGGFVLAWEDLRSGDIDLYANRVNASGARLWGATGVPVVVKPGDQRLSQPMVNRGLSAQGLEYPKLAGVSTRSGNGGLIVMWEDLTGADRNVYAQRMSPSGVPLWTANGLLVAGGSAEQSGGAIVSDGADGAVIAWLQGGAGGGAAVRAQRVDSTGTARWNAEGVELARRSFAGDRIAFCSDGSADAELVWQDARRESAGDVRVQRIDPQASAGWQFTVTASAGPGGSVTPAGASTVALGADLDVSVRADAGHRVVAVTVDGDTVFAPIGIQLAAVSTDHAVVATFEEQFTAASAGWLAGGAPVSTQPGKQTEIASAPDGLGGTFVVWRDACRDPAGDIRAQHLDPAGVALWGSSGVTVSAAPGVQADPQIVSDGAGGAYVAWDDYRDGGRSDLYAQRLDTHGASLWAGDGLQVAGTPFADEHDPHLLADGAGGVILAWRDQRNFGATMDDVYAQRLDANGVKQWGAGDVAVAYSAFQQMQVELVGDGAGGAFVLWHDVFHDSDIWAQRLSFSGAELWTPGGVPAGAGPQYQYSPVAASDGAGGLLLVWEDLRSGDFDIYANRLDSNGQRLWGGTGIPVVVKPGDQRIPNAMINRGLTNPPLEYTRSLDCMRARPGGGLLVAWEDRNGPDRDVRMQKLDGFGTKQWPAAGVLVASGAGDQWMPVVADDGADGAYVMWRSTLSTSDDRLRVRRVAADGTALGIPDGGLLASAATTAERATLAPSGFGDVIAVWSDSRSVYDSDVYAQRITGSSTGVSYEITAVANPGGAVFPAGRTLVGEGGRQDFQIMPNEAARIDRVLVDGVPESPESGTRFETVTSAHRLDAFFVTDTTRIGQGWLAEGASAGGSTGPQREVSAAPDGSGGTLVAWRVGFGAGVGDIHVQRLDAAGVGQWGANGVVVCADPAMQADPQVASDGAGGAYIAWSDYRDGGHSDLYAQRVNAAGAAQWSVNGIKVSGTPGTDEHDVRVLADGAGNVILAWRDQRNLGATQTDCYAQKLDASGAKLWGATDVAVSTSLFDQVQPMLVTDGLGGAFVLWHDVFQDSDIWGQHLRADGSSAWVPGGMPVGSGPQYQYTPTAVSDGEGGFVLAWEDLRSGDFDLYANRVSASGARLWGATGVPVVVKPGDQRLAQPNVNLGMSGPPVEYPKVVDAVAPDGTGGLTVVWVEGSVTDHDVYVQRLGGTGAMKWSPAGVLLAGGTADQTSPVVESADSGAAIVAWLRDGTPGRLEYQIVDSTGTLRFPSGGAAIPGSANVTQRPVLQPAPNYGVVACWTASVAGADVLRAQRIAPAGTTGFDHHITVVASAGGRVSPPSSGVFAHTDQAFTIVPAPGQRVATLTIDGADVAPTTQWTFAGITGDHTLAVTFAPEDGATASGGFMVAGYDFEDAAGVCQPRGWSADVFSTRVFSHVSARFVTNDAAVSMGTRALWVGADSTSAASDVRDWVSSYGFGGQWRQRVVSPVFDRAVHPAATFTFDATLGLGDGLVANGDAAGHRVFVQGLRSDSSWVTLATRWTPSLGAPLTCGSVTGSGVVRAEVRLADDGNAALALADQTRFRLVVETDATGTMEDGGRPAGAGAAVIDNLRLRDGPVDLISATDFENGLTGAWTLLAANGTARSTAVPLSVERTPPASVLALAHGVDAQFTSCLWRLAAADDSLHVGVSGRLRSAWIALAARDSIAEFSFSGRLPVASDGRALDVIVRGKRAGDAHARMAGRLARPLAAYTRDAEGGSPAVVQRILRWPADFVGTVAAIDSLQLEWRWIETASVVATAAGPLLDEVRVRSLGVDGDGDGIADALDACPTASAAGEDADGDGCLDPHWSMRHVEFWPVNAPVHWTLSSAGDPRIVDGSDLEAVRAAFADWAAVPGAALSIVEEAPTAQKLADALDGVNLVTFEDDFAFPPNVLAITPTTSFSERTVFHDRIVRPGEIVDADMIFNPSVSFSTPATGVLPDGFDLRSVALHEAGHFLGLSHTGVLRATMFPVLQPAEGAASLEDDDRGAIASAYPGPELGTSFGTISGIVRRGGTLTPVPGALVLAVRLSGGTTLVDTVASAFTREDGRYALRRLPPASYAIRIQPLDGSVPGLIPGAINARIAIAAQPFAPEWWSTTESASDDPSLRSATTIAAGQTVSGRDLITNLDTGAPAVVRVSPASDTTGVDVESVLLVEFNEPVNDSSLAGAFKLRRTGDSGRLGGQGQLLDPGTVFVFRPSAPLLPDTPYEWLIDSTLTDVGGQRAAATFVSHFRTAARGALALTRALPSAARPGALVHLLGSGFDSTARVVFMPCAACAPDTVTPVRIAPSELLVRVPASAASGPVVALRQGSASNSVGFTRVELASGTPDASGAPIALGFAPVDVALSADGALAVITGETGIATVRLVPGPDFRVAVQRPVGGSAQAVMLEGSRRALVTQPTLRRIVELDADPASATFGQVLNVWPVGGEPVGLEVSPDERRAYATDRSDPRVFELDVDASSAARGKVVRVLRLSGSVPSHALAASADGGTLWVGSDIAGALRIDLATGVIAPGSSGTAYGVAAAPDGIRSLEAVDGGVIARTGVREEFLALAARPRDLRFSPAAPLAFAALGAASRLVSIAVDSTTALSIVGDQPAPAGPTALAVSANGAVVVVACSADRSLATYSTAGAAGSLTAFEPSTAVPGQMVVARGSGNVVAPGSTVQSGGFTAPLEYSVSGTAVAFRVPEVPMARYGAALVPVSGARSGVLPLDVVTPLGSPALRSTGIAYTPSPMNCVTDSIFAPPAAVALSPDDQVVALLSATAAGCPADSQRVTFLAARSRTTRVAGELRRVTLPITSARQCVFAASGRELWLPHAAGESGGAVWVLDADPASPSFGNTLRTLSADSVGHAERVRVDPMGRALWIMAPLEHRITRVRLSGIVRDTLALPSESLTDLAVTPDGRWLLVLGSDRLFVFDASAHVLIASSAPAPGAAFSQLVVEGSGARAWAHRTDGRVVVWDLSLATPAALLLEQPFAGGAAGIGSWLAGPDARSVLATAANSDSIWTLHVNGSALEVARSGLAPGAVPTRLAIAARSADGRALWGSAALNAPDLPDALALVALTGTTRLDLVAGDGQSGASGQTLATPVRARVIDEQGRPQPGLLVRFELADSSQGLMVDSGDALIVERFTDLLGEAEVRWRMPTGAEALSARAPEGNALMAAGQGVDARSPCAAEQAALLAGAPANLLSMRLTAPGAACALLARATVSSSDSTAAPRLLTLGPADGATGIYSGTTLFARFTQRMDAASVAASVQLLAQGSAVPFEVTLTDEGREVLLQPESPLPFGAEIELRIPAGVRDQEGQVLFSPAVTRFQVESEPALALRSMSPAVGPAGARIVLSGRGFSRASADNTVFVNGVRAAVQFADDQALAITVPSGITSGPVNVQVGSTVSNSLPFRVLERSRQPGGAQGSAAVGSAVRDMAVTPDGRRMYVTQPGTNSVAALSLATLQTQSVIPVGREPLGIGILSQPVRAYIANRGSDDVSVIDADTASATFHQVVATIPVGRRPVDLAVSEIGPRVLVVCAGDSSVSLVDARRGSGSYDRVVKTVKLGSSGTAVAVTPDGGRAYIAGNAGIVVFDLRGDVVVKTIKSGSGSTSVAVTPDGGLLFALLGNGELAIVELNSGSTAYETVVKTVKVGSSSTGVAVTADGGLLYVTARDGNVVYVYSIERGAGAVVGRENATGEGDGVSLSIVDTTVVGSAPQAVRMSPDGALALVANEGSGSVSLLETGANESNLKSRLELRFDRFRFDSFSTDWASAIVTPPAGYTPGQVQRATVRLQSLIPADSAGASGLGDADADGTPDVTLRFRRAVLPAVLREADSVIVNLQGVLSGDGSQPSRTFSALDTIRVRRASVSAPVGGQTIQQSGAYPIHWNVIADAPTAAVLQSFDAGRTWALVRDSLANSGGYAWPLPSVTRDSVQLAVIQIERRYADGGVEGTLALSGVFRCLKPVDVGAAPPLAWSLSVEPNPVREQGVVRFALPHEAQVRLMLHDVQGRRVASLMEGKRPAGWYTVDVAAGRMRAGGLASGLYFVSLEAGGRSLRRAVVILR